MLANLTAVTTLVTVFCILGVFMRIILRDWENLKEIIIASIVFALICGVCWIGIIIVSDHEMVHTKTFNLASLNLTAPIIGKDHEEQIYFYTLSNSETLSFFYYTPDGEYKKGTIPADNSKIYERDKCVPQILEYTTYTKYRRDSFWQSLFLSGLKDFETKNYKVILPSNKFNLHLSSQ